MSLKVSCAEIGMIQIPKSPHELLENLRLAAEQGLLLDPGFFTPENLVRLSGCSNASWQHVSSNKNKTRHTARMWHFDLIPVSDSFTQDAKKNFQFHIGQVVEGRARKLDAYISMSSSYPGLNYGYLLAHYDRSWIETSNFGPRWSGQKLTPPLHEHGCAVLTQTKLEGVVNYKIIADLGPDAGLMMVRHHFDDSV